MSYPPYPGGGAPYPPTGGYPQSSGPWVGGGMPMPGSSNPPGYPPQSGPPMPGYPPPPDPFSSPAGYPPGGPTPSYPPPPSSSYPPDPSYPPGPPSTTSYPPGPPSNFPSGPTYPPGPTPNYPPGPPSNYPPGPSSNYPPGPPQPGSYPTGPSGGGYPTSAPPGSYPQATPVPSDDTRRVSVEQTQRQMAAMSVSKPVPATHGTVKPSQSFNAENDATTLYNAMKGLGTDEKAIILVLTRRSNEQRQEIKVKFKVKYGKDLIKELKSELSGHFREVIIGLMMRPTEFDAYCLNKAMEGAGTDETALIEILCSRTNVEKEDIKTFYKKEYKQDLEKHIHSETSGHFRRLLISLTAAARDPDSIVDKSRARQDAQALYKAGEGKWGTDESTFNQILCARSYAHLRLVFEEYSKICKYDIEQSISREMSGDLKTGMTTIVKCVRNLPAYFSERLYKSMKGLGTDDRTLVRVMVSRCEVDMVEIKSTFERNYGKTLESFIKGDTSGDYKRVLLALAGEY
ncbi:PREDICTED: annexin A4-like isoform X2 [Amphimedon queenslandica]|uniref:Annexin n=1 Tax=Amphimedon queenslandica TaxID=400682 RepID=A0A1X7V673_AMPQE|nr:PREDICTED: annexin A4-like isoform X2 [Amphimedon queenslandica]|eukprot:XP_019850455.1 PREDICTED: annexin A4-like isoform X2 [Amphimedon queenslandica]